MADLVGYTEEEAAALRSAALRNCECEFMGEERTKRCPMCSLLEAPSESDIRLIKGLLFERRNQSTLTKGEFEVAP